MDIFANKMINTLLKGVLFVCLIVIAFFNTSITTHGEESMFPEAPIFIDGQAHNTKYLLKDGNLMVPALFLKHTSAKVDWNEKYNSVVFTLDDDYFAIPIGTRFADSYFSDTNEWKRDFLSTPTIEVSQEVFVPLIDVVKKLGMKVEYNQTLNRTFVYTQKERTSTRIYSGNPSKKLVALTFDDGPEAHYTPQILDILKEKGVPATFFVMGKQVKKFPDMMRRIVEEGHGLANHTYTHPSLPTISTSEVIKEIRTTEQEIERTVGRRPDLFRPPFGAVTWSDERVIAELGFRTIMWTVDTLDWTGLPAENILEIVHRDITPGGIILQHNIEINPELLAGSVEALPMIIDDLRSKGYTFVTVQTLLDNR
ncbi:peptidoglycan/xylan/chitin deacetylase (PgdA/CDA1 family) [Evansella vedderi]|uniref:Peptidoglycan/xylan/chitin deacetylase (PgdA/CDA1 family) n=1 Tax=Evansella vedderi TaxID=38282 RepID=A0ABT9ZV58_9BACI|nr:polysaccharide deacetylase family protein [Evansella vedderi]MDQ0255126.1 peptidoglycan/xylan/chitin deacetylase (PgdA/CDA1 family) [Evansella vedderi]